MKTKKDFETFNKNYLDLLVWHTPEKAYKIAVLMMKDKR